MAQLEPGNHRAASQDEEQAKDQRSGDPKEEDAVLCERRHGEGGKDHREYKEVVDGEAVLDQVAGKVLARRLRPEPSPNHKPKRQSKPKPHGTPDPSLAQ